MASDAIIRLLLNTNEFDSKLVKSRRGMKDFGKGANEMGGYLKTAGGLLTKLTGGLGATAAAMKVAKDAFMRSESNIDAWGRATKSAGAAYKTFLDTLNSGNWRNFFSNLNSAINGAAELYDKLDRLGSIKSNNEAAIAIKQKALQELKLRQKNGENVTAEINKVAAEISAMQSQQTNAGKQAGLAQTAETIKNRVNAAGGKMGIGAANVIAGRVITGGQAYIDQQNAIYKRLGAKATVTQTGYGLNGTSYQTTSVDLNRLSKTERDMYVIAKAVTEGETEIQQGIHQFAQAIGEEAGNIRQQARYTQSTGGGGSHGGDTSDAPDLSKLTFGNAAESALKYVEAVEMQRKHTEELTKAMKAAADATELMTDAEKNPGPIGKGMTRESILGGSDDEIFPEAVNTKVKSLEKGGKSVAASWQMAASAVATVGTALSSVDDPATKVLGTIAQAIATMTLAYAQATAQASEMGPWAWAGFAAAGLAVLASTVSTVRSLNSYAEGGIVGGQNYTDGISARISSGEMVINEADQKRLYDSIHSGNFGGGGGGSYVRGEDIILGINNTAKRKGWGELSFSRR